MQLTLVARSGNRRASATATRMSPIVSEVRTVEIGISAHEALDDGGEQRLFAGKFGVDGRLSGTGRLSNFVDARAAEPALEKHMARRIEDSLLDLPGKSARRATAATSARRLWRRFRFHRLFHLHPASFAKTAIAKNCAHAS
jgi:hypothetical protein